MGTDRPVPAGRPLLLVGDVRPGCAQRPARGDLGLIRGERGAPGAVRPALGQRADTPGGVLSGGEQQMLTICRTLMGDPHLVMVDEPTEGLAPMLVTQVADLLVRIAARGVSILLVEQKLTIALTISQRVYVMGHGRIVFEGTPAGLTANDAVRKEWLEV